MHPITAERIRLHSVDRPEKSQAYGTRATQAASVLVFGKYVIVQTHGKGKYGHTLADVQTLENHDSTHHEAWEIVKE